jgi:hypothetical protein
MALTWIAVSSTPGAMVLVAMALFNVKLRHVVASGRVVTVAVIYFTKTMWKEKATPTILHSNMLASLTHRLKRSVSVIHANGPGSVSPFHRKEAEGQPQITAGTVR